MPKSKLSQRADYAHTISHARRGGTKGPTILHRRDDATTMMTEAGTPQSALHHLAKWVKANHSNVRSQFKILTTHHLGLSQQEMEMAFQKFGVLLSPAHWAALFDLIDTDASGYIDYVEFSFAMVEFTRSLTMAQASGRQGSQAESEAWDRLKAILQRRRLEEERKERRSRTVLDGRKPAPKSIRRSEMRLSKGPDNVLDSRKYKYTSIPDLAQMGSIVNSGCQTRWFGSATPIPVNNHNLAKQRWEVEMKKVDPPHYRNFGLFEAPPPLRPLRELRRRRKSKALAPGETSYTWGSNASKRENENDKPRFKQKTGPSDGYRHRFHFKGHKKDFIYETPWNDVEPSTYPALRNPPGLGYIKGTANIFDRADVHNNWRRSTKEDSTVEPSTEFLGKIDWFMTGQGTGKHGPLQSSVLHIEREVMDAIGHDWDSHLRMGPVRVTLADSSPEDVIHIPASMRLVVQLGLIHGSTGRDGAMSYMQKFQKHHELVHKWELERALDTWGAPDHPYEGWSTPDGRKMYTLRFEFRFRWARQAPKDNYAYLHPELQREGPTTHDFWPDMEEIPDDQMSAPLAFERLSAYITQYHSNVVSEFRNFDKDSSGALSTFELSQAFKKLGVKLPIKVWETIVKVIDDNDTGEVEYEELLAAMDRFQKGGWEAVMRKYQEKLTPEEEQKALDNFHEAMDKIRKAAYSNDHSGARRDVALDLKRIFKEMDKDGDNMITKEELASYLGFKMKGQEEEKKEKQEPDSKPKGVSFEGDADMPAEEEQVGVDAGLSTEELDALFRFFDRDGGGCDFGEFAYSFYNRRKMAKRVADVEETTARLRNGL